MTVEEMIKYRKKHYEEIRKLRKRIDVLEEVVSNYFPEMEELRKANADDIKTGAVIYYPSDADPEDIYATQKFWQIVNAPLNYGDAYKAYMSEDGDKYGLNNAYVKKENK